MASTVNITDWTQLNWGDVWKCGNRLLSCDSVVKIILNDVKLKLKSILPEFTPDPYQSVFYYNPTLFSDYCFIFTK